MKAIGIERRSPRTTAASEPSTTNVNTMSCSWKSGAMSTPPRPARTMVMIHAAADVRAALTPRMLARDSRSTTARISRPTRVRRMTNHSTMAARAATTKTAIWSEFSTTPPIL